LDEKDVDGSCEMKLGQYSQNRKGQDEKNK
jgi:hypothetical protein